MDFDFTGWSDKEIDKFLDYLEGIAYDEDLNISHK